jgi:hypothetical protein
MQLAGIGASPHAADAVMPVAGTCPNPDKPEPKRGIRERNNHIKIEYSDKNRINFGNNILPDIRDFPRFAYKNGMFVDFRCRFVDFRYFPVFQVKIVHIFAALKQY